MSNTYKGKFDKYDLLETTQRHEAEKKEEYEIGMRSDLTEFVTRLSLILLRDPPDKITKKEIDTERTQISREAEGESHRLGETSPRDVNLHDTVSKINKLIDRSISYERSDVTTRLLQLKNKVTSKRIEYLEDKNKDLQDIFDKVLQHILILKKSERTYADLLTSVRLDHDKRVNELQHKIDEQERLRNTEIYDIRSSIKQLKEQVTASKKQNKWHGGWLGADASAVSDAAALPALLERL